MCVCHVLLKVLNAVIVEILELNILVQVQSVAELEI